MSLTASPILFAVVAFVGILLLLYLGHRFGKKMLSARDSGVSKGIGAIDGAVFALMGLLTAFTFSGAASRFEDRRHLITQEANDIGTAWMRLDLLPADVQPSLREMFKRYVSVRVVVYRDVTTPGVAAQRLAETAELQRQIWAAAVAAVRRPDAAGQAGILVLPALNQMFDITTTRQMATQNHPPDIIYLLLLVLTLLSAFLAGFEFTGDLSGTWLHRGVFALLMAVTLFVIVELEYPRRGFIRIDEADQAISEVLESLR